MVTEHFPLKYTHNLIGLLSDAHGNFRAFELAINLLKKMNVKEIVFLGDAIGYIPSIEVVEYLMSMSGLTICVRGNHEAMLLQENTDKKCDQIYQLHKTRSLMNEAQIAFISQWVKSHSIKTPAGKLLFVHGSSIDPTFGYVYPDTDLSIYATDADFVFMGNSHYPFIKKHRSTTYVNVGSCGLPRDDGRYGSVALFDTESGLTRIMRFDIRTASANMLKEFPDVHGTVKAIFNRKAEELIGELHDR